MHELSAGEAWQKVFVPLLGDFFSIRESMSRISRWESCFRPLSWGLSFNFWLELLTSVSFYVFVPFLGDFLSILPMRIASTGKMIKSFRPLSWGLSFNSFMGNVERSIKVAFSSPFLGTFDR